MEARKFTAKILGDEVDSQEDVPSPTSQNSKDQQLEEDLESKAELWI